MTESQLKAIQEFKSLPIYDESDELSVTITSAHVSGVYEGIRECSTLRKVQDGLKDHRLVPLGALRVDHGEGPVVVAYFGVQS